MLGDELRGDGRIRYVPRTEPLGTAGPLRLAADEGMLDERFLVLNGDVLTDLDLSAELEQHERTGARATLALYPVDDPTSYGLVPTGRTTARSTEFLEKPEPHEVDTNGINAGAYVIERAGARPIPRGPRGLDRARGVPAPGRHGLYGLRLDGYWIDIGTPERYLEATWDILEGRVETVARVDDPVAGGGGLRGLPVRGAPGPVRGRPPQPHRRRRPDRALGAARELRRRDGARVVSSILSGGVTVEPGPSSRAR